MYCIIYIACPIVQVYLNAYSARLHSVADETPIPIHMYTYVRNYVRIHIHSFL